MEIVMKSFKNILKKIGRYFLYFVAILCSLIVVGIAAGITFYFCVEYSFKDINQQQIQECLKSGLSEEICKGRIY